MTTITTLHAGHDVRYLTSETHTAGTLGDPSVAADVLDALDRKLDGSPASPSYFSRRRRVVHRALGYAVRKKRLSANPLSKAALPEGWTAPRRLTTRSTTGPSGARNWSSR